ncbi:MAG TPA: ABC transporter permease [Bryobacteraceae bacterium]|nr:ABC transporter permease [Bryobacteraceae bacterium]
MNLRRTRAIARKEFLHILRDARSLTMALALPFLMLLLFGYALSLDVDRIPVVVYDRDQTPQSRDLIHQFSGSRYFHIVDTVDAYPPIERSIDSNQCLVGLVIPRDYARNLKEGRPASVQLLIDGSDSNTAGIALGYADALVETYAAGLRDRARNRSGAAALNPPANAQIRVWYNSDLVSRNYIVPGLIAVILMIIASMLTSLTIAREWDNGTMEQLLSTPVRPAELVLGKLSAYFMLGIADMLISVAIGAFVFGVPLKGSVLLLFFASCMFLFGALCWGLMLSAIARTQLLAYQMGVTSSFLPAFLLSGFIYSVGNMPKAIQAVSYIVPARYFVTILKGIFLKGVGLNVLWLEMSFLSLYALAVFVLATRKMRQKVV